jgi:hypothetical protein
MIPVMTRVVVPDSADQMVELEFDVNSVLPAAGTTVVEPASDAPAKSVPDGDQGPVRLRAGRERSFARRIAAKALEISAATEPDRAMLAGLLGCDTDVVALTVEVMNAPRGAATRAVADLDHVAAADPMEAPIRVATRTRERQRALWNLLTNLGAVSTGPPQNEFKQALATAKAVFAVDTDTRRRLVGAVQLARRY